MFRVGRAVQRPKRLQFPVIVKSLTQESSIGISQASVVEDEAKLLERVRFIHRKVGTDAIAERYIEGRELYVGVIGNLKLQVFPVWEMKFDKMPEHSYRIATERVKWNDAYQKKHGITTVAAGDLPEELAEPRRADLPPRLPDAGSLRLRAHRPAARRRGPRLRARGEPEPAARLRRGLRRVGAPRRRQLRDAAAEDPDDGPVVAPGAAELRLIVRPTRRRTCL